MSTTLETPPTPPRSVRPLYWIPSEALAQFPSASQTTTSQPPTPTCACTTGAALTVKQGADLRTELTLTVTDQSVVPPITTPVDITGCTFLFTAKVNASDSDSAPTTVKVNWVETNNPTQGITWFRLPASITVGMQAIAYVFQIWMVSAPPSGVVSPLVDGTLTVTEPISTRSS